MSDVQNPRRRSVAARILISYALVIAAFAVSAAWSILAQRSAAREADLMRSGYLPLAIAVRDLAANQDTWNTQLNHVTAARNPADKRVWFETALSIGRPKKFAEVGAKISHTFLDSRDPGLVKIGAEVLGELQSIEKFLQGDSELVRQLFESLNQGGDARAEDLRDRLVTRGSQAKRRLAQLELRVQREVDGLLDEARQREELTIRLSFALILITLCVGVAMAFHARRVLRPLGTVTERAKAVGRGDLTPREVTVTHDEIGELASTFEHMVSEIARANEQLISAERLATVGKMAAHVTHEIRNPLSAIALNLDLLEEELGDNLEAKTLLGAIGKEVDRLSALSEEYLSFARRKATRLESEDLVQLVKDACSFVAPELAKHKIQCQLEFERECVNVAVDENQIKQALFNLIRNAREAMPDGGTVVIRIGVAESGFVELAVEDEGPGMDEEVRAQLFEPFFTTKGHGTGLGLAVTRQIIDAHGGRIHSENRPGGGTRMVVTLPIHDDSTLKAAETP